MEVISRTNGQVPMFSLQRSGYFTCSHGSKPCSSLRILRPWQPIFGLPLCVKSRKKMRTSFVRMKLLSELESNDHSLTDKVIEKEFEFKPSFEEYLKAMESVRSVRGNKQDFREDQDSSGKDSIDSYLLSLVRDEKTVKRERRSEGVMATKKVAQVVKDNELGRNRSTDKFENRRENRQRKNEMSSRNSVPDVNLKRKSRTVGSDSPWLSGRVSGDGLDLKDMDKSNKKKAQNISKSESLLDTKSRFSTIGAGHEFYRGRSSSTGLDKKEQAFKQVRFDKDDNKSAVNKYGLVRRNVAFPQYDSDDDLHVERAAFNSFGGLKDVKDKPRASKAEMEERVQKLAKSLNGADIDMPEWIFSKTMRSARIKYADHTVLRIIQILGKLGNWRRVLQVIEWLQMCERYKSHRLRNVYTTALDVLGKAQRPKEALHLFQRMLQQISTYPDIVAYHSIAVTLGQAGYMKELFDVIDTMRSPPRKKFKTGAFGKWDPRLEPDVTVYNAVLNACVRRKQWEGAFWVLQQLKQEGLQPSAATYGLIMEVMLECEKYNLVHEFFRKVRKSSIPNALVYRVLLNTLWREGKTDEAVSVVEDMERRGIVGSAALYYDLARCLCSAGRCHEALAQIEKICNVANKPLVVTYTGLIQACLDSGNVQNAAYIFNEMKNFCTPNLVTCNVMLKAYLEHRLFEDARELFQNMSRDGQQISCVSDYKVRVLPDTYSFNSFLDACAAQKRWDDFGYVYNMMLSHGYHFNPKRHLRMVLDASRDGKVEVLELTWNHLVQAKRPPPPPLVKERFCVMLEKDDYNSAIACITANPDAELQAYSKKAWLNLFNEKAHIFKKDTLLQLVHVLNAMISKTLNPSPILLQLLISCKDCLRTREEVDVTA